MQLTDRRSQPGVVTSWASYAPYLLLGLATLVYVLHVYHNYRVQWDDGYITFRFAQHLATGQGLTWNSGGERVEGFTSLLQVLLLALGMRLGVAPEAGAIAIGVTSVLATVGLMTLALRRHLSGFTVGAAVIVGLYLVDETTAIHSTSGLETPLFVALLATAYLAALAFVDAERGHGRLALGLAGAVCLTVLGRPEAVLYGAALYAVLVLFCLGLPSAQRTARLRPLALSAGLLVLLGLVYAAWKVQYFGYLLPNPFYVKSGRFALAGVPDVLRYVAHLALWYGPAVALLALAVPATSRMTALADLRHDLTFRTKTLLTLAPPLVALAYYVTIIHEVGGAYRFSYPTYFYVVLAVAACASVALRHVPTAQFTPLARVGLPLLCLSLPVLGQTNWSLTPLPTDELNAYHFKIAYALQETGLGAQGTVVCDAAGIIPYISGFNHIDRVGLTDNFLSGRHPLTQAEREAYIWSRNADVYVGVEPPASPGAVGPADDPLMRSPYVAQTLMRMHLSGAATRVQLQEPGLLHARMRELRDHWTWVGEMDWPGQQYWGLKSFLYVRRDSPHAEVLLASLRRIIALEPAQSMLKLFS